MSTEFDRRNWLAEGVFPFSVLRHLQTQRDKIFRSECFDPEDPSDHDEFDRNTAYNLELGLEVVWDWLELPFTFAIGDTIFKPMNQPSEPVPPELLLQIVGQKFSVGMTVLYQGTECYVICLDSEDDKLQECLGQTVTEEHLPLITALYGVDARLIDINA